MPYGGDTFFNLTPGGRAALVALAVLVAGATVVLARRLARGRAWPLRLLAGLGAGWAFVWLSPQAWYGLYLLLFDGLPAQVVVGAPPGPGRIAALMTFAAEPTLSAHGQGLVLWAALAAAALRRGRRRPRATLRA